MTAPTVRVEILTVDDDGSERVDVLEATDHAPIDGHTGCFAGGPDTTTPTFIEGATHG